MKNTWVLVMDRSKAAIYNHNGPKNKMSVVKEIENPRGKLHDKEINSAKFGGSSGGSNTHHTLASEQLPSDHILEQFAKSIANFLDDEGDRGNFENIIIISGPHTLGVLLNQLNHKNQRKIIGTINKDLAHESDVEIQKRIYDTFGTIAVHQ